MTEKSGTRYFILVWRKIMHLNSLENLKLGTVTVSTLGNLITENRDEKSMSSKKDAIAL
jgi:hypothetical protein